MGQALQAAPAYHVLHICMVTADNCASVSRKRRSPHSSEPVTGFTTLLLRQRWHTVHTVHAARGPRHVLEYHMCSFTIIATAITVAQGPGTFIQRLYDRAGQALAPVAALLHRQATHLLNPRPQHLAVRASNDAVSNHLPRWGGGSKHRSGNPLLTNVC